VGALQYFVNPRIDISKYRHDKAWIIGVSRGVAATCIFEDY
jgi:hypothetical protein